jgi:hypothetical protein
VFARGFKYVFRHIRGCGAATRDRNCEELLEELLSNSDVFIRLAKERGKVMLSTVLIILLILLLIGALPTWPYSTGWGYYPGGGLGLVLIIVVVLVLAGRI